MSPGKTPTSARAIIDELFGRQMTREIWTAFPTFTSIRPAISMYEFRSLMNELIERVLNCRSL